MYNKRGTDKLHVIKVTVYYKFKLPISSNKTILQNEQFFIDNDLLRSTNNSLQVKMNITVNNKVIADMLKTDEVKTNNNEENKDKIMIRNKKYRLENKLKISQYNKQYVKKVKLK